MSTKNTLTFSRHLFRGLLVVFILCLLASGCAKKIVKPGPGQGPPVPSWAPSHPVLEQQLQAVQASLRVIYFDYDKYALSPEAQAALQENAEILRNITLRLAIAGQGPW